MSKDTIIYMGYASGEINLTWRDLKDFLSKMPDSKMDDNITMFSPHNDEYYPVHSIRSVDDSDVVDEGS